MRTLGTLFSGGGIADIGAMAAGVRPIWAIEYCPKIAASYRANIGDHVTVADVCDVDPADYETPDQMHASPPCTTASVANSNGGETECDRMMARAVCRFIAYHKPRTFTLENVEGYRKYQSMTLIRKCLWDLGYWHEEGVLNAADYGVPQTRRRLILRASRDGFLAPLPSPVKWIGWYAAIEDLLPGLPEGKLAKWQLERLPKELTETILFSGYHQTCREGTERRPHEPSPTVIKDTLRRPSHAPLAILVNESSSMECRQAEGSSACQVASDRNLAQRAILIEGTPAGERPPTIRQPDEPAITINGGGGGRVHRAFDGVRIVAMTPRCLARFQSIPDSYVLPQQKSLACTVIGNGLPSLLYQAICRSLE